LLKANGFKRKAPHFWRENEGIVQCVNFQASQWGSSEAGSFTINLGVTSPTLYSAFTGREMPKSPASVLWPVNKRIGHLTPDSRDLWWKVGDGTDIDQLGKEVAFTLAAYALPFLDSLRTPQLFHAAVLSGKSVIELPEGQSLLVRAALAAQSGEGGTAQSLLEDACRKYKGKPFEAAVRRIAAALGMHT
jgi:hypothetical protein